MDISCLLAALFFFVGNILLIVYTAKETRREHYDHNLYLALDPVYLQEEWNWRLQMKPLFLTMGIINGFAWFFFSFPMIQLAWILSHRGTKQLWLHTMIGVLALVGSFTEWISRFLYIGSSMATTSLVKDYNLENWIAANSNDGIGWRALEVVYIVTSGLIFFLDAFEWLAMFLILTLVYVSVRRWRSTDASTFGGCWNSIGLFMGILAALNFVAEILMLNGFTTFDQIAFWYAAANRLLLLPIWLFVLGIRLPYAALKINQHQYAGEQQEQEQQRQMNGSLSNGITTSSGAMGDDMKGEFPLQVEEPKADE